MENVSRFKPASALWGVLIILLMAALLWSWKKMKPDTTDTAYELATQAILDRANAFKQIWLVHKGPQRLNLDKQNYHFSTNGWLLPLYANKVDCHYWLTTLYPAGEIFGSKPENSYSIHMDDGYMCRYNYPEKSVVIQLSSNQFTVRLEDSAL